MGTEARIAGLDMLSSVLDVYIKEFGMCSGLEALRSQMNDFDNVWDRRNWRGHITASAIVLDASLGECLMMSHKKLSLSLAPGGHCDEFEHPRDSAARELEEECGISKYELHEWHSRMDLCPIDIDAHIIPDNATEGEPAHTHYDFRYVFLYERSGAVVLNDGEGTDLYWCQSSSLGRLYPRVFSRLDGRLKARMEKRS